MRTRRRTEWDHGKKRGMSGKSVMQDLQQGEMRRQLRNAVGELRMRQIQAQNGKQQVRDYTTKLLAGRIQLKSSKFGSQNDLNNIDIAIAQKAGEYRDLTIVYFDAIDNENRIFNEVGDTELFWKITNDLPRVANLVDIDADFIATLCALDILKPDVRRYILSVLDFTNLEDGMASGITGVGADREEILDVSPIDYPGTAYNQRTPEVLPSDTFFTPLVAPYMITSPAGRIATPWPMSVIQPVVRESIEDSPTGQISTRVDDFLEPQMVESDNSTHEVVREAIANAQANGVAPELISAIVQDINTSASNGADAQAPNPISPSDTALVAPSAGKPNSAKQFLMLGAAVLGLAYVLSGD